MDFWLPWMYLHPFCTKFPWSFSSNVEGISNHWMFTLVFSIVKQFKEKMLTFLVKYHNPKQQWIVLSLKKDGLKPSWLPFSILKGPLLVFVYIDLIPTKLKNHSHFQLDQHTWVSLLLTCTTTRTIMDYTNVLWK